MNILITGGTGFIGERLVKKLSENNKLVVLSRNRHKPGRNVRFIIGDVRKKNGLGKAFSGIDVVYHLAANIDDSDPHIYNDNVTGTRNVAELCREFGVKKLIYMGSCGAVGNIKVSKEDSPYNPKTKYEKSKAESEKIIMHSGVPYAIIRAPVVIGPNRTWLKIFQAAEKGYPIIGSGNNHFHLAYVDDVVDILCLVKSRKEAENEIFNVATKDAPTYEEVYRMICDELDVPMTKKHVPIFVIKIISSLYMLSCRIRKKKPSLTMMKSSIDRLIRNRIISTDKAKNILGFEPKYDTKKAIKETAKHILRSELK